LSIIHIIQKFIPDDLWLAQLFERVQEYAELYLIAKQRQKGCDGMGEVATLKDEFIYYMDGIIRYCKEKGYLSEDASYEIDSIARYICELKCSE
jgi:hypothetical protein